MAMLIFLTLWPSSLAFPLEARDRYHGSTSAELINGEESELIAHLEFLLTTDSVYELTEKAPYIDTSDMSRELLDSFSEDYVIHVDPGLKVLRHSVSSYRAFVSRGNYAGRLVGDGIGFQAKIGVLALHESSERNRIVTISFPGAMRLQLLGSLSPPEIPTLTFKIENFVSEGSQAESKWVWHLLWGIALLVIPGILMFANPMFGILILYGAQLVGMSAIEFELAGFGSYVKFLAYFSVAGGLTYGLPTLFLDGDERWIFAFIPAISFSIIAVIVYAIVWLCGGDFFFLGLEGSYLSTGLFG